MNHSIYRRRLLLAGLTLPLYSFSFPLLAKPNATLSETIQTKLAQLEHQSQGRLGVSLINTENGQEIHYRGEERFPFCSTFKLVLAAAILQKSMSQPTLLSKRIRYTKADLLSYAPVTNKNINQGMSIDELCEACIQYSDNTAANLLLKELGGLNALNLFMQGIGDQSFRIDRWEPELNSALPDDLRDTTTPLAMAASIEKLVIGNSLATPQREQLITWIQGNTTGNDSIRAGLPTTWQVGDKTGSGSYGTTNDVAVLWPPHKAPLVLAVYFTQHQPDAKSRRDVLAAATRIMVEHLN